MKRLLAVLMSALLFTHSVCYQSVKAMMGCPAAGDSRVIPAEVNPDELKRNIAEATKRMKSSDVPRLGMALDLQGEIATVGDLHGDSKYTRDASEYLQNWLAASADRKVLFLGDIFDRGDSTTLTLDILLKFYLRNPGRVFILKGNHESFSYFGKGGDSINEKFINENVELINDYIRELPYAAVINNTTFASHAGIPSLELPDSILGESIQTPDNKYDFFTNSKENEENRSFWEYTLLWADFMDQKISDYDRASGFSNGRPPFDKDDLKDFFSKANKIEFSNGRRLNLHHMIAGHNHNKGPHWTVDLGEEQTFGLVISTPYLYEEYFKQIYMKRYRYSEREWSDFVEKQYWGRHIDALGCVLVVCGEHQAVPMFNRTMLKDATVPGEVRRVKLIPKEKLEEKKRKEEEERQKAKLEEKKRKEEEECQKAELEEKKCKEEEECQKAELEEKKQSEEDYRRRLNLAPGTTLGKGNYSGNKAEEVFEITRENVNFMCFISEHIPGKCEIDKDKVIFKCEYDVNWAIGRIQILPLSYATMLDSHECIEMLLKMGANINARDVYGGNTALHHAVLRSNVDIYIIKLLLENGADPNIGNNNGKTVLGCTDGRLRVYIKKYLELRRAKNERQDEKIVAERQKEVDELYKEIVQFERRKIEEERRHSDEMKKSREEERKRADLMEKKRKEEEERQKAEMEEEKREEERTRKEEEKRKAQEIRERDARIESARKSGLSVEVHEITRKNINDPIMIIPNWKLECNFAGGKICLINKGNMGRASVPEHMLPLGCAAMIGDIDFVYECIAMQAKVNEQDSLGNTALHYAAMEGRYDIIKVLLDHGARINIKNKKGKTAIDVAKKGFADFIKKYYQDVVIIQDTCITPENVNEKIYLYPNEMDYFQYNGKVSGELPVFDQGIILFMCARITTPLMYAIQHDDLDFAKRLIAMGADVNGKDNNGRTALHAAFDQENEEMIYLLLDNGAND